MYILKLKQGRVKQRVLKFFEDSLGKVSVQGVAVLGCHFATLCQEVDFYEAIFFSFSLLIFKKKTQILLHF